MAIVQSRIIAIISAARAWEASWRSLHALNIGAALRHQRGEITGEQLAMEITSNSQSTEPPTHYQVTLAVEDQHFRKNALRNEKTAARNARARLKKAMGATFTPKRQRPGRPGMLNETTSGMTQESIAHAKSTAPAFAPGVNPLEGLATLAGPPDTGPTEEQLAADMEMYNNASDDEKAEHFTGLRKGTQ